MTFHFLGPDRLEEQVRDMLSHLADGRPPSQIETTQVDVKEEPGRRRGQTIEAGERTNEKAASQLTGEMACMANTPGGGALIVGIADDGTRIGTELDSEWLRHRIYQLSEQKLTVDVREAVLGEHRILVLTTHEAVEPIRHNGRIRWRVEANCVEVDATTWHSGKLHRSGTDWSAQLSGHTLEDVSQVAVEIARRYIKQRGSPIDHELAEASTVDLLRRLHLADSEDRLTNAGSLLFVGTPHPGIDCIRRETPGGDSRHRVRSADSLLEQIFNVERASESSNRTFHVAHGFSHGQHQAIPSRAIREAIVNGTVHRDWQSPQPTSVEHAGDTLTVTSPGGFIGGIEPSNIISHPAVPRYRGLAEAAAALGIAERQGVGVARMTRDMLAIGRPPPEIYEIAGPYVRVSLFGGEPAPEMVRLVTDLEPLSLAGSVEPLLLIDGLRRRGWIDAERAGPVLQRTVNESADSLFRLETASLRARDGSLEQSPESARPAVISRVAGTPAAQLPAYRLSDKVRSRIGRLCPFNASAEAQLALVADWARARGRVSTTEVADLTGLSVPTAGRRLSALVNAGELEAARPTRAGRGFHYLPTQR